MSVNGESLDDLDKTIKERLTDCLGIRWWVTSQAVTLPKGGKGCADTCPRCTPKLVALLLYSRLALSKLQLLT